MSTKDQRQYLWKRNFGVEDSRQHKIPHMHVKYQENEAVISIPEGDVLEVFGIDFPKDMLISPRLF